MHRTLCPQASHKFSPWIDIHITGVCSPWRVADHALVLSNSWKHFVHHASVRVFLCVNMSVTFVDFMLHSMFSLSDISSAHKP